MHVNILSSHTFSFVAPTQPVCPFCTRLRCVQLCSALRSRLNKIMDYGTERKAATIGSADGRVDDIAYPQHFFIVIFSLAFLY